MDNFVKVFDIADSGFRSIGFSSTGILLILAGVFAYFAPKILKKLNLKKEIVENKFQKIFALFFLGFSIFWTATAFYSTYQEYLSLKNAECKTVSGHVENFSPMPYSGHKHESYTVQGVYFDYSDFSVTNGFNNTASHGGPVNKDSFVRVCYVARGNKNIITKLEVKDYSGPIKDYSGSFTIFPSFDRLNKSKEKGAFGKDVQSAEKVFSVAQGYVAYVIPFFLLDLVLYILIFAPFFNSFVKICSVEHAPIEIESKYLNQEKHSLEELTVKYDGSGVLWGRPYGIDIMNSPGFALKMYLSPDKSKITKSEIRFSALLVICFLAMLTIALRIIGQLDGVNSEAETMLKFFPFFIVVVSGINFWVLKRRFQKKVKRLL